MNKLLIWIFVAVLAAGCATQNTGVVSIGPDTYMIGGLGGTFDHSGSVVKARFFQEAKEFCADQGKVMIPINSVSKDAGLDYSSAEVQFRCADTGK